MFDCVLLFRRGFKMSPFEIRGGVKKSYSLESDKS